MPGILEYFRPKVSSQNWPQLDTAWAGREIEMPKETAAANKVRPMNWYEKNFAAPDADAITWPWGTIALNRDVIEKNKQDLGTVLAHELTHVKQNQGGLLNTLKGLYRSANSSYDADPKEQEAFAYEGTRPVRTRDISLDPPPVRRKK
jgi:hypothetical protein